MVLIALVAALGLPLIAATPAVAATASLSGTIKDGGGTALGGSTIVIYTVGTTTQIAASTAAANGSYTMPVDAGTYDVVVNPPAGSGFHLAAFGSFAISGATVLNVVLSHEGAVTWSGVLKDSKGSVLPGVTIYLSGPANYNQTTTSTGGFSFRLAPGQYTIQLSRCCGSSSDWPVTSPTYFQT
ncbi:MAG: carboxypeptidase regulatory-like domain-containing protein, partial [Microthrixaceae bacterium]